MMSTERLLLSIAAPEDVVDLSRLWTDEWVRKYLGGPLDECAARERAAAHIGHPHAFAIRTRNDNTLIGLTSISTYRTGDLEVSYLLFPEHWGKGYGPEAVTATIAWAFENLHIEKIIAVTQSQNIASTKLLKAIGMTPIQEFEEFGARQTMFAITQVKDIRRGHTPNRRLPN